MQLRKYRIFWGVLYEGGGEKRGGTQSMCQTTMKEDIGTTRRLKRRKGIVVLGKFRINFNFTLLPISNYCDTHQEVSLLSMNMYQLELRSVT